MAAPIVTCSYAEHSDMLNSTNNMFSGSSLFVCLLKQNLCPQKNTLPGSTRYALLSAGGDNEREEAYQEAVKAVFEKGASCHRHLRCYTSRKTGKRKWTVLEMWPIADPLDGKLAVMVSEYNMTQQKELELQLSAQHLSLQRSAASQAACYGARLTCMCIHHRRSTASSKLLGHRQNMTMP